MKKSLIPILVIAGIALVAFMYFMNTRNDLVVLDEGVNKQWAKVETQYQRRADLIPNLVSTVKGYADFEKETLTKVIEARAKATAVTIDPSNMSAAQLQNFQQTQGELSSALSRLMVSVERYPNLKANQNFLELQAQLEGTENRISVERNRFNDSASDYNIGVRKFPANMVAGLFGFDKRPLFESDPGAKVAPKVQF